MWKNNSLFNKISKMQDVNVCVILLLDILEGERGTTVQMNNKVPIW